MAFDCTILREIDIAPSAHVVICVARNEALRLPYLLGFRVFIPDGAGGARPWASPPLMQIVQWAGLLAFSAAVVWAAVAAARRSVPTSVRRLGALGLVGTLSSLGGFLVSSMPEDVFSARYLAPIIWFAPFTLAPAAHALRPRSFAIALRCVAVPGTLFAGFCRGLIA